MNNNVAVDIQNVTKMYGAFAALKNVNLDIRDNEFFTLLGPSGCGKTTLLRTIAGFEDITNGAIVLYGQNIADLLPNERPVNTVFQQYALFPHMNVTQNIMFGLLRLGHDKITAKIRVGEVLELVQLSAFADRMPNQLSGGQQQRVALARAIAPSPKVLLLDEPLSALDLKLRQAVRLELQQIQHQTDITFIFVTHDQEEALTMSDRIAVMSAGSIRQIGRPRDIYDHPAERFVADFIGDTNFLPAELVSTEEQTGTVRLASGQMTTARIHEGSDVSGQVTLAIRPEHASLVREADGVLAGTLGNVVYFGTDTHYHVGLDDGTAFVIRTQNSPDTAAQFESGARVGVTFGADVAQVLRD